MSRNGRVWWRRVVGAAVVSLALEAGIAGAQEQAGGAPPKPEAPAVAPGGTPQAAPVPGAVTLGEGALVGEMVLKGRRPTRTESLEAREVRERGARDLGEALSSMPSLDKVRKGGIGNDLVLRGMKKDDVAVTIDGAKVHGACPSRMDPPTFHLDYAEVDAVLVKRGPFDVSQTGSLGGAIDVSTRRAHRGLGTELNLEGGSASLRSGSLTGSYGAPRWDVLFGGALKQGSPYVMGSGQNFTEAIPQFVGTVANGARYADRSGDQDSYRIGSAFGRVGLAPAEGHRIEIGYAHQSAPLALYPYLKMDGVADDTDRVTARWSAERVGPVAATVSAYWNRVAHDMTDERRCSGAQSATSCGGVLPKGWSMGTEARSRTWGGQAEVRGGDAEALVAWKAGADLYVRTWDNATTRVTNRVTGTYSTVAQIPDVEIRGAGAYGEAYRSFGEAGARTRITAGLRLDLARTEAGIDRRAVYDLYYPAAGNALTHDDVLVGGNLQIERELGRDVSAWIGYGHGTRVADPQERYMALEGQGTRAAPDWLGQPGLDPVHGDEVDLGATWRARGVLLKAQAFHAWYASYVTLVEAFNGARWARTYDNVSARTFGGEVAGRFALPWGLFAGLGASFTRGINDTADASLPEIPPFKTSASLRWDDGRFFVEVEELYAAAQRKVDPGLQETSTPAWWTTTVKAGVGFRGAKVFASVSNLFDRHYFEHLSYQRDPFASGVKVPEPGRFLQVAAQYAY